jgi:hypothetical protein
MKADFHAIRRRLEGLPEHLDPYLTKHVAPEAHGATDFDWPALYGRLREARADLGDRDWEGLCTALASLLEFIVDRDITGRGVLNRFGRRAIALAWVVNPELLRGASLWDIGKRLGYSAFVMSEFAASASRIFGVRNPLQRVHGRNFQQANSQEKAQGRSKSGSGRALTPRKTIHRPKAAPKRSKAKLNAKVPHTRTHRRNHAKHRR